MIDVFRESGFQVQDNLKDGCYLEVKLSVVPNEASVARSEFRDRLATVASLQPFFRPRSVAVVGASRDPSSIGFRILDAVLKNGFAGAVFPINPRAAEIDGVRAYPSVRQLPEAVDLAVVAVPRDALLGVIDDCAARGVRGASGDHGWFRRERKRGASPSAPARGQGPRLRHAPGRS